MHFYLDLEKPLNILLKDLTEQYKLLLILLTLIAFLIVKLIVFQNCISIYLRYVLNFYLRIKFL